MFYSGRRGFERKIDEMVYDLYGLTEEEIKIAEGGKMNVIRIKQTVTNKGIIIPLNKIQSFKGKKVEIIILSDSNTENPEIRKTESLKKNLSDLFQEYNDLKPFKYIDPLQWEREIRNEW